MTGLVNRLAIIEKERLEDIEYYQNKYRDNPELDEIGRLAIRMKSAKRFIALCDYKLRHDIQEFRKKLAYSSTLIKSLYDRYDKGEPIDESFVTMNSFGHILDACAAGDFALAESFANVIGGRETLEKENDHPFDFAFGYALKALILSHTADLNHWLLISNAEVKRPDVKYFQGYVDGLYAIKNKDTSAFMMSIKKILQDHCKMCRTGGLFENNDDEVLCFWGLGLMNLARHRGLKVMLDHEYLPADLVI